jgi:hypothetical protein
MRRSGIVVSRPVSRFGSTTDRDLLPAGRTAATDPEALIAEARRRTRRRRLRAAISGVVLVGSGVLAFFASNSASGGIVAEAAGRPFVDVKAFRRDGELAFISRGALWLLDGVSSSLRRLPVPAGYAGASPAFSPETSGPRPVRKRPPWRRWFLLVRESGAFGRARARSSYSSGPL